MRLEVLLFCCALTFGQNTSHAPETKPQTPASSSDQKSQNSDLGFPGNKTSTEAAHANGTAPAPDLVGPLDGTWEGTWEGDLIFLQGATLDQKGPVTVRYRLTIQGPIVHVYIVRPQDVREIKPFKFHMDFLMTNAVVYETDSGHDDEGTWVETWAFTLTQIDKDTVLTNFSRMVNNLDLPLSSDHSKFAREAVGKLRRISDDNAGILGSGQPQGDTHEVGRTQPPPVQPVRAISDKATTPHQRVQVPSAEMGTLLVKRVRPEYPDDARAKRIQGTVMLRATVSREGNVIDVSVISGDPELSKAALRAAKKWKYHPYLLGVEPVEVETTIQMNFQLSPN